MVLACLSVMVTSSCVTVIDEELQRKEWMCISDEHCKDTERCLKNGVCDEDFDSDGAGARNDCDDFSDTYNSKTIDLNCDGLNESLTNCQLSRGHFDCPNGSGCLDSLQDDEVGMCSPKKEGPLTHGSLCDSSSDCVGGICLEGLCTFPCDFFGGCPSGYECDLERAPPEGICVPQFCKGREEICAPGYSCGPNFEGKFVCAAASVAQTCSCLKSSPDPLGLHVIVALLCGLPFFRRRKVEAQI